MYGKRGLGGSAAVLDAPPGGRVPEPDWPIPEPAPAGTLQRRTAGADADSAAAARDAREGDYSARRQSSAYRLCSTLLRTVGGRIVGGSCAALGLAALLAGALVVRRSVLHDPRFTVTTSAEIQVTGNRHVTRAQVLSVFGADLQRNIFKIPLPQRREDLERLPWVADATVMRLLPHSLRISLTERTPAAFVRQGSHIGLVDGSGVLLDMPEDVAGDPHYSFPVLTGLADSDALTVRAARMAVYHRFMQELDSAHEKLTDSVSEVDVSNPEDVKAVVTEGGVDVLVHFGDEKFLERYRQYARNLPQWKNQYPKLASVDTRYNNEFVLEMQSGSPVPLLTEAQGNAAIVAGAAKPLKAVHGAPPVRKAAVPGRRPTAAAKAKPAAKAKKPILVHAWTPGNQGRVNR